MPQVGAGTERMTTVLRIAATFWSAWSLGSAGGWWIRTLGNCALGLAGDGNCALLKVCAPSLEAVKARLDRALGSLIGWLAILPMVGGRNWMIFKVPCNLSHSVIDTYSPTFPNSLQSSLSSVRKKPISAKYSLGLIGLSPSPARPPLWLFRKGTEEMSELQY